MVSPERIYLSSLPTTITSPYARLAQSYNLLGRIIRHCDDRDPELAFMLEEVSTLHQATSALLEMISHEEPEDSYVASSVCFRYLEDMAELPASVSANISSALMKLHKSFLYNSFHGSFITKADSQLASHIREYTAESQKTMRDVSLRAVNLALSLEQHIALSGVDDLSPLILHSL